MFIENYLKQPQTETSQHSHQQMNGQIVDKLKTKHYAAIKSNEVLIHITTWVKVGDITPHNIKKEPVTKTIYAMILLI